MPPVPLSSYSPHAGWRFGRAHLPRTTAAAAQSSRTASAARSRAAKPHASVARSLLARIRTRAFSVGPARRPWASPNPPAAPTLEVLPRPIKAVTISRRSARRAVRSRLRFLLIARRPPAQAIRRRAPLGNRRTACSAFPKKGLAARQKTAYPHRSVGDSTRKGREGTS
jgi:hypothetical protein